MSYQAEPRVPVEAHLIRAKMCLAEAGYPGVEVEYMPDGVNVGVRQGVVPPAVWWRCMATLQGPAGRYPCFECWRVAVFGGVDNRRRCADENQHPDEDGRPTGPPIVERPSEEYRDAVERVYQYVGEELELVPA